MEQEKFSGKKLIQGFNILSWKWWCQAVTGFFKNVVMILILAALIFGVYSAGQWQGKKTQPVLLGYKDFKTHVLVDEKKVPIEVKNHILYVDKVMVRVKDVPELKQYGIGVRPKLFAGIGNEGIEAGLGATVAWYRKFNLDIFGTQRTIYIGCSRDIDFKDYIKNSSIGFAVGTKYEDILNQNKKDVRFLVYWSWRF